MYFGVRGTLIRANQLEATNYLHSTRTLVSLSDVNIQSKFSSTYIFLKNRQEGYATDIENSQIQAAKKFKSSTMNAFLCLYGKKKQAKHSTTLNLQDKALIKCPPIITPPNPLFFSFSFSFCVRQNACYFRRFSFPRVLRCPAFIDRGC